MARTTDKSQKTILRTKHSVGGVTASTLTAERRHTMVAESAYFLAEQRHFAPGGALTDWLAAEALIRGQLGAASGLGKARTRTDRVVDASGP